MVLLALYRRIHIYNLVLSLIDAHLINIDVNLSDIMCLCLSVRLGYFRLSKIRSTLLVMTFIHVWMTRVVLVQYLYDQCQNLILFHLTTSSSSRDVEINIAFFQLLGMFGCLTSCWQTKFKNFRVFSKAFHNQLVFTTHILSCMLPFNREIQISTINKFLFFAVKTRFEFLFQVLVDQTIIILCIKLHKDLNLVQIWNNFFYIVLVWLFCSYSELACRKIKQKVFLKKGIPYWKLSQRFLMRTVKNRLGRTFKSYTCH